MTKSEKKELEKPLAEDINVQKKESEEKKSSPEKEETIEEKLNNTQEKLLRTLAEMENQRRRFEKEKKGSF